MENFRVAGEMRYMIVYIDGDALVNAAKDYTTVEEVERFSAKRARTESTASQTAQGLIIMAC